MELLKDGNNTENQSISKYQCSMKCEDGKTYDQAGNCPVCNMKLVAEESGHHHH